MEERIKKIIGDINGEILVYQGQDMIEDGIIDSLEVMEIVSALEKEFQVEITVDDIVMENFQTICTICALVEGKMK